MTKTDLIHPRVGDLVKCTYEKCGRMMRITEIVNNGRQANGTLLSDPDPSNARPGALVHCPTSELVVISRPFQETSARAMTAADAIAACRDRVDDALKQLTWDLGRS